MPNWKAPGRDGVQGFWIKNLTSLYNNTGEQLDGVLNANKMLPGWMTYALRTLQGEMQVIILDQFPALRFGGNS